MFRLLPPIFLLLIFISCKQKQIENKEKERIDNICDKFMQNFAEGKISEAITLLKQNSAIASSTLDTLEQTVNNQINTIFPTYGNIISSEFIFERKVKNFLSKRFYVLRFDQYYLKFDFTLYYNEKKWTITSFNYNEDLIELLY